MSLDSASAAALGALKSGGNLMEAAYGGDGAINGAKNGVTSTTTDNVQRDSIDEYEAPEEASFVAEDEVEPVTSNDGVEEEESKESEGEAEEPAEEKSASEDVEEVVVTDDQGKRKIKIDYNDRERVKKAHIQAAGMRKFQAERDKITKEYKEYKADASPKLEKLEQLSSVFEKDGLDGMIRLLTGGKQTLDSLIEERNREKARIEMMSPAERRAYEKEQEAEELKARLAAVEKAEEERNNKFKQEKIETEVARVSSHMQSSFEKYRFDGRLGDPSLESRLDRMLWNDTKAALAELPEDIVITPQLIRDEFKAKFLALNSVINKKADKKVRETLDKKKVDATKHAQAKMVAGAKKSGAENQLREDLKSGNSVASSIARFLASGTKKKK